MIVKRGNKFRVISEKGKNLGESDTKSGAAKRLGEVEYFKHAKCMVSPDLVKQQQYQPVVFQGKDKALGNKPDKDFPSTPLAYDLKDSAQPEFPSATFSGQPYAQSFSNPHAGQGNDPDIQHKGSDYRSHTTAIGEFASVSPSGGGEEKNSTGRGRNLIQPAVDLKEGHVKSIKRAKSIRESSMSNTNSGGQTSDMSRSVRLMGTNIIFKQQLNDFNYPIDRGSNIRVDPNEEAQKRKDVFNVEKIKQKQKEYNEHRESIAREKKYDSYLGRAKDSKPIGEYKKEYPGAKVTFDQPIDPTKKPRKVFTHLSPEGQKVHLQRIKKKSGEESLQLSLMYTQNQPFDPSLKPLIYFNVGEGKTKKNKTKKSFSQGMPIVGTSKTMASAKTGDFSKVINDTAKKIEEEKDEPVVSKEITDEEERQGNDEKQRKQSENAVKSFNPVQSYNPDSPNKIKGGIGDKLKPKDVDDTQLVAGINVEQEHVGKDDNKTEDEKRDVAQDIALDHLKEDKDYYTKLNEMERHGKAVKKEETKKKKLLRISKNEVGKSVVSLEDFKQYRRNTGKMGPTKHPEKEIPGYPRPMSVVQAEGGRKPADVYDIKTKERLDD